jgi:hypothetical protein
LVAVAVLMVVATAMPALAQPQNGLVNITLTDVLNNNQVNVQVPIGVAANLCGINANILAHQRSGPHNCTSSTTQDLPVAFRPPAG